MKPISQGALGENPPRSHRSDHGPHRSTILLLHTKSLRIIETSIFSEGTSSRHSVFRNPSKSQLFAFFFLFHTACLGLLNAEFPLNRTANNKNIPKTFSIPKSMVLRLKFPKLKSSLPCLAMINHPPWNVVVKHPTLRQSSNQFVNLRHTDVLNQHFRTKVLASRIFLPSKKSSRATWAVRPRVMAGVGQELALAPPRRDVTCNSRSNRVRCWLKWLQPRKLTFGFPEVALRWRWKESNKKGMLEESCGLYIVV